MSAWGQTEKNSVRAYVFRFALKLGHRSTHLACLKGDFPTFDPTPRWTSIFRRGIIVQSA
jgi:hypothetical protein